MTESIESKQDQCDLYVSSIFMHWPVIFRASLYFLIAALPVIMSALDGVVNGKTGLSAGYWWLAIITAIYQGLVALRAYYDGSPERKRIEIESIRTLKS